MPVVAEDFQHANVIMGQQIEKSPSSSNEVTGFAMIPEEDMAPVTSTKSVPRIQPPTRPPPAPPVMVSNDKSLPPTPTPGYTPPASNVTSPYSQASTPGCGAQYFQPPPSSPPISSQAPSYQPMTSRTRRRKSRSPSYLPLEAYPPGPNSNSPAFATGYPTPGQYYGTTPPSSTPSLSPPVSAHGSPLPSHHSSPRTPSSRRSSLAPPPSRSYPTSAAQTPYSSTFSPVPLSAAPMSAISGRPVWYAQDQHAQSMTPDQLRLQETLEADAARKNSIGGLLASAAATLSISPDSPGRSPGSQWSASGPILPGGGSGKSSRRQSFSELTGPRAEAGQEEGKGAWGYMVGFAGVAGKKLGEVEGGMWRWARGKRAY
ncbi:hypothetical protein C1H76_9668 [Elsinoe australis]|uniref:Uncharacterized protein n=1 Tax=Elsinoe australis TaxID=40998 RepID=A0A4U7AMY6_9PEZI|nr:hypothetical protein C1H76_9668 [Elsinoe australis]